LYWSGLLHLWMVYGLALGAGMFSPATEVGVRVVIPQLVPWKELERANALSSIAWDAATLIGPALAGFLVYYINAPSVLLIDAATFLFMGSMALSIPHIHLVTLDKPQPATRKPLLGFSSIFSMRAVGFLTLLTVLFLFAQGLTEVVIPVYSLRTLHAGSAGYGLLMSAFGGGSLLALAFISKRGTRGDRQGLTLAIILFFSGALLAPLILVRALPIALVVMGLAGLAAAPYYVVEQSLMQRLVPERLRGQIFGARGAINVAGYPLGGALGGLLLGVMAAPLVIGIPVLLFVSMGCACLCFPAIRGLRRESGFSSVGVKQ
jgi:MFS family permease